MWNQKWNQNGISQVDGFGVGIFLRNVIYEWKVITITYRPKGQVDGRGGEIRTPDILLPKFATRKNGYSRKLRVCNVF